MSGSGVAPRRGLRRAFRPRVLVATAALLLAVVACTSNADLVAVPADAEPGEPGPAVVAVAGEGLDLPEPFTLVGVGPTMRSTPEGAVETSFVAVVGLEPADPRFLEVTVFDFDGRVSLDAARPFVGRAQDQVPLQLDDTGVDFAFLPPGAAPDGSDRSLMQLAALGPRAESVFRGGLGDRSLAVGAARILQPSDVDLLLPLVASQVDEEDPTLPLGLRIIVDRPLGEGVILEVESNHGTTAVEIRDEVPLGWFEYLSWDDPTVPVEGPLAQLGVEVSIAPPASFGPSGEPVDPQRVALWEDGRLVVLTHPPDLPAEIARRLYDGVRRVAMADLVAAGDNLAPVDDPPRVRSGVAVDAPTTARLGELQRFVEDARGLDHEAPIEIAFVDYIPVPEGSGVFVSQALWNVLERLSLVAPGQSREEADEARRDRIRGTPSVIELQTSVALTEVVAVHEMTHVLDPPLAEFAYDEVVYPAQALVEGNAHRIAYDFLATLPEPDRSLVPPPPGIFPPAGDPRLSPAMQNALEFPYDEGRAFAVAVAQAGGEAAIEEAFANPPVSSEQILFPETWIAGELPEEVAVPDVPDDARVVQTGTLGAYVLLLAVELGDGAQSQPIDGRPVVQPWAGDTYVIYERATGGEREETCLLATVRTDSPEAAQRLVGGLRHPDRSVVADGDEVAIDTCG